MAHKAHIQRRRRHRTDGKGGEGIMGYTRYYQAFCKAHGAEPETLPNWKFINWIGDKWKQFEKETGMAPGSSRSERDRERFERWLTN